jgi:long-chain acyl-CoA synthetase
MTTVPFTLAGIVREYGATTPEAPALTFESTQLNFRELDRRSSQVAHALRQRGVGVGDRVAVLSKNRPEFLELAFGCNKLGGILVGLNWRLAAPEIEAIIADASPTVLVVEEELLHLLGTSADPGSLITVIRFGAEFNTWRDSMHTEDPGHVGEPNDTALLLYTSGTTGVPKGVCISNHGMSFTKRLADEWSMTAASVNMLAMPLFHVGGIGYGLSTMCVGGNTVLMREVDPSAIIQAFAKHRVTHSFFVPAVIQMIVDSPEVHESDLTSLELICYGAAPIGDALLRRAIQILGCGFTQAYGMTETSGTVVSLPASDHDPDGPRADLLRSCGRALPWVELRVIDPNTGTEALTGVVGEIWIRSEMVTTGYWNKPDESAAAITADGWLRTGDAAYLNDERYIFLFDRFKDMIVTGAENVYPAEVENALADHPAVAEVAVIGIPSERWGETVKAFVVLRPDQTATDTEMIEFARTRIARYKCPTSVDFVTSIPRNASGKILKKDLRAPYWEGYNRAIS